jgi:hypothetical protein
MEKKHAGGRPSKYDPKFCEEIVKFFDVPKSVRVVKAEITGKNDYSKTEYEDKPNPLPTFSKFARSVGICHDCITDWAKIHPEFTEAYNVAKELQKEFLMDNGLAGLYPPASFIFTAKNITDMKDKTDVDVNVKTYEHFKNQKEKYGL